MMTGPLAYILFKRLYGGLYKIDPKKHPLNIKTKLAMGDTKRIAFAFALIAVLLLIGRAFLPWYEDPAVYAEAYGKEGIFDTFMTIDVIAASVSAALAICFGIAGRNDKNA